MKSFNICDIPEFSNSERIVVIGVIGKSPYNCGFKAKSLRYEFAGDKVMSNIFSQNRLFIYIQ